MIADESGGALTLASAGGLTRIYGDGFDGTLEVSGDLTAAIHVALGGLAFEAKSTSAQTIALTVTDGTRPVTASLGLHVLRPAARRSLLELIPSPKGALPGLAASGF